MNRISPRTFGQRTAISTALIAAVVVIIIVIIGVGAYVAVSGGKTTITANFTATVTSGVTNTATVTSAITNTATVTSGVTNTATVTSGVTNTATVTSAITNTATVTSAITNTATTTLSSCTVPGSGIVLNGAGGTLVFPVMTSWTFAFHQVCPNVEVNYASVGSGTGINDITAKTVDFGESDAPLTAAQYAALPATLDTIPISASAVVPAYNLPNSTGNGNIANGLKFTGAVLARIFLGNITQWNDPAIVALNPGVPLPAHAIIVVHRSDSSGTMFAFTDYLSDSNAQWKTQVGKATNPNWPTGIGCKGNEGVAGCISNNKYSIGPLEIAYEIINVGLINYGSVQNAAGNYILANLTNAQAAVSAAGSTALPAGNGVWTSVSIIDSIYNNTQATNAYPITTFTYALLYQAQTSQVQGQAAVGFLWWVVNSGQSAGTNIGYVPLPSNIVQLDDATLNSITYNGVPIL